MLKKKRVLSKCVNCKTELSKEERRNPICPKCGNRWDGGFMQPDPASRSETQIE
jgi:ribosomal protein L37AE/L43A